MRKSDFTQRSSARRLRVIGVTPGYDLDFKQADATGSDTFAQALAELERAVSILTWGTVGLIAGGSGFSNSDLFERNKAAVLEKRHENKPASRMSRFGAPCSTGHAVPGKSAKRREMRALYTTPKVPR